MTLKGFVGVRDFFVVLIGICVSSYGGIVYLLR